MAAKKVVILGGGISALATAYQLTSQDNWHELYDITIYTMGWRLGGKVASSRNTKMMNRLQDTGMHFCPGFYENEFKMLRECYAELTGSDDAWLEAFVTQNTLTNMEPNPNGGWYMPPIVDTTTPEDGYPGDGEPLLQVWEYFLRFVRITVDHAGKVLTSYQAQAVERSFIEKIIDAILHFFGLSLTHRLRRAIEELEKEIEAEIASDLIRVLEKLSFLAGSVLRILNEIIKSIEHLIDPIIEHNTELRRDWMKLETAIAVITGILRDEVLFKGFATIDQYDFMEWLERNGASKEAVNFVGIRGIYEGLFAFEDGDLDKPNLAAGVALYVAMRWGLTSRGGFLWRMKDSTGVAIFSPIYSILKKRGDETGKLRFKFFHRVRSLNVSEDEQQKNSIASITVGRQVDLKVDEYEPIIDEDKMIGNYRPQFWPAEPRYEQINDAQAKELQAKNINLEHYASDQQWKDVATFDLKAGVDYDMLVMAIPVGAIPCVTDTEKFNAVNPAWKTMLDNVPTVTTQGFQIWLKKTVPDMGWNYSETPIVSTYQQPYPDWGDYTFMLNQQELDAGAASVLHFAVVLPEDNIKDSACDLTPEDFPKTYAAIQKAVEEWLSKNTGVILPDATSEKNPQGLDWNLLFDFGQGGEGAEKLNSQLMSPNIDPSIRYDITPKGSPYHRIEPDNSGFENMVLAGSWTDNGLNASLMEGAVMSGMLASNAVSKRLTGTAYPPKSAIVGLIDYEETFPRHKS